MSFTSPPANQFASFTSAMRKPYMQAIGFVSPGDNIINAIWSIPVGGPGVPAALAGTINGVNRVFTCPTAIINGISIYINGVYQDPLLPSYTVAGQIITFAFPPQVGDAIQSLVS